MNKILLNLSVKERLMLPNILPTMSGRIEMIIVKSIMDSIEFSPDEVEQFELEDNIGSISGNISKFKNKDVYFSNEQIAVIRKPLNKLDDEGKVNLSILPLMDKVDAIA